MKLYRLAVLAFAGMALGGWVSACAAAMTAGADFDQGVDFSPYATFAWAEADGLPVGDARLENNPFFTDRLHAAIQAELERRGIRHDERGTGLLVHHHTSVRNHVDVYEVDRGAGYTGEEYGPGTQVVEYEEGTFLVDIADAESKEILWRGWALANVDQALNDPAAMAELLQRAVSLMFERYPVEPAAMEDSR
jgi:hypothetical protein